MLFAFLAMFAMISEGKIPIDEEATEEEATTEAPCVKSKFTWGKFFAFLGLAIVAVFIRALFAFFCEVWCPSKKEKTKTGSSDSSTVIMMGTGAVC